jgi:hypothetical protein
MYRPAFAIYITLEVMNPLTHRVTNAVLRTVLSRPCGSRIPRSGEKGAAVNCFVTAIDKGEEPYLIVQTLEADQIGCIQWDGRSYSTPCSFPITDFGPKDFRITHYYGLSEIRFTGILDCVVNRTTRWPYITIHTVRVLSRFDQYLFNKKKLISKERKGLLKVLVNEALDGHPEHETLDLMTALYSIKWFSHPQGTEAQQRLEFYLESLVETGELRKVNHRYVVTGQALRAIEEYEEQERKHTENVKIQSRTFWVAVAVAALTVVQAGLIKLPPFLDFSSKNATETQSA